MKPYDLIDTHKTLTDKLSDIYDKYSRLFFMVGLVIVGLLLCVVMARAETASYYTYQSCGVSICQ